MVKLPDSMAIEHPLGEYISHQNASIFVWPARNSTSTVQPQAWCGWARGLASGFISPNRPYNVYGQHRNQQESLLWQDGRGRVHAEIPEAYKVQNKV